MAEAEPEPGIRLGGCVDVRDAPAVTPDAQRFVDAGDPQCSRCPGQPSAQSRTSARMACTVASASRWRQAHPGGGGEDPSVYSVG